MLCRSRYVVLAAALAALPASSLRAAQYTWTGGVFGNNNWSATAGFPFFFTNWNGGFGTPPSAPDTDLVFGTGTGGSTNNDLGSPFLLNSLLFNGPSFNLTGGALQFMNDGPAGPTITSGTASPQTISMPVLLGNDLTVISGGGGAASALTINGAISAVSPTAVLNISATASDGTVILSGNNTLSGTTVNGGVLKVTPSGSFGAFNAALTVNATGAVDSTVEFDGVRTVGSLSGTVAAGRTAQIMMNGNLAVDQSTDTTYQGQLHGPGFLIKAFGGNLTLQGATGTFGAMQVRDPGSEVIIEGSAANLTVTDVVNATTILNGGQLTVRGGAHYSLPAGGITLQGAGSSLLISGAGTSVAGKFIGADGTTTRTVVEDGAVVSLNGSLNVGNFEPAAVTIRSSGIVGAASAGLTPGSSITIDGGNLTVGALQSNPGVGQVHLVADHPFGSALVLQGAGNFSSTYAGSIDGAGGITNFGPGSHALTGVLSYTGPTIVNGGTLLIGGPATDGTYFVNNGGTLHFTGNTVKLNFGSINVNTGGTAEYKNATVIGGFLGGRGVHLVEDGTATFNGTTMHAGPTLNANNTTTLRNFTSGGTVNNAAGQTLNWLGGFNTGGTLNVNGTTNYSAVVTTAGVININNGGTLNGGGSTTMVVGGGSRMTINAGGKINLGGTTLELNDALLVNNGEFVLGTTNVNYGSLAMGSGTYGPLNVRLGGRVSPGNSPGRFTTGATTWGPGGSYLFEVRDANGPRGIGHDLWHVIGALSVTATNTPNGRFTVQLQSLDAANAPGLASNFDPNRDGGWLIAQVDGPVSGFAADKFTVDASGFANPTNGGVFGVTPIIAGISGIGLSYTAPQWNQPGGGSWGVAGNWVGGVPTLSANFLSKAAGAAMITLDGDRTVAGLRFDNEAHSYSIVPGTGGRLTLDSPTAAAAAIEVFFGTHTIAAPLVLADDTVLAVGHQDAGLSLTGGVSGSGAKLTKSGPGRLNLGDVSGISLDVTAGPVSALPAGDALHLNALTLAPATTLDLTTRDLVIASANLNAVTGLIASARNTGTGGLWSGAGLTTSAATALTGLGIATQPDGSILVKFTYTGDADLNGMVDPSDFFAIDRGRAMRLNGWVNGDFDYSGGFADAADYMLIDRAFLSQGVPLGGLSAPASAVPEPAALAAALLLSTSASLRRRRR